MPAQTASRLLTKYWDGVFPIDPAYIATKLDAIVLPRQDLDGASGMIELIDGVPLISYLKTEARVRQRFTVAHELGHLALGHLNENNKYFRDTRYELGSGHAGPIEQAANLFAASILMPAEYVEELVLRQQVKTVSELAIIFDVSEIAMGYRLNYLGYSRV